MERAEAGWAVEEMEEVAKEEARAEGAQAKVEDLEILCLDGYHDDRHDHERECDQCKHGQNSDSQRVSLKLPAKAAVVLGFRFPCTRRVVACPGACYEQPSMFGVLESIESLLLCKKPPKTESCWTSALLYALTKCTI